MYDDLGDSWRFWNRAPQIPWLPQIPHHSDDGFPILRQTSVYHVWSWNVKVHIAGRLKKLPNKNGDAVTLLCKYRQQSTTPSGCHDDTWRRPSVLDVSLIVKYMPNLSRSWDYEKGLWDPILRAKGVLMSGSQRLEHPKNVQHSGDREAIFR